MYHNNNIVSINGRDNIKLIYNIIQKHSKINDKKKLLHIIKNKCIEYNNYYDIRNLDQLTNINELIIQYIIDTYLSKKIEEKVEEKVEEKIEDNNLLDYNDLIKSINEEESTITNYLYTPENININNISYKMLSSLDNEIFNKFIFSEDNVEIEYILIPKNLVYLPYIKISDNIFIIDKEVNNNIIFKSINSSLKWDNIDILEITNIKLINNKICINDIQKRLYNIDIICNNEKEFKEINKGDIIELKTNLDIDDELNKINNMYSVEIINKNLITLSLLNDNLYNELNNELNNEENDIKKLNKNVKINSSNYYIINHSKQIHIIYKLI